MPALRAAGSSTFTVARCGLVSTPSLSMGRVSTGFLRAFMMLCRFGKRGWLRRRSAATTAGRFSSTTWRPASISRVTFTLPSATAISDANVPCGASMSPASSCGVEPKSPSTACLPRIHRSGLSSSCSLARTLATASGSSVAASASGTTMWIALSQPSAIAVRRTSSAFFTPTVTAITSVAIFFSFSRTASSRAISQNGFTDIFTLSVCTLLSFTRILTE
mmetsp:Transcript_58785/g.67908  ORF Transcript_58785/g.67908 Transcript_58785/m.67908 type:complete len:220 (-) Transcript_58785:132-791(-)